MGDSLRPTDTRTAPKRWAQGVRGEKMRGFTYSEILRHRGLPVSLKSSLRKAARGEKLQAKTLFKLGAWQPRKYSHLHQIPTEVLTYMIKNRQEMSILTNQTPRRHGGHDDDFDRNTMWVDT